MDALTLFLSVPPTILLIYLIWFLYFADCDLSLTLKTMFGRPVSVFKEKIVWITGASSGLGEAMAYELASVGAKLILSGRNVSRLEEVKNKCLEDSQGKLDGSDIFLLPFDVTHCDVHETKLREALDYFKQVDVLINNAGRFHVGCSEKTEAGVICDLFDINYFGPVNLTKVVLRYFLKRGKGQFLCIASSSSKIASPGLTSYSASKHALYMFYESLRNEYGNKKIDVTVTCPGFFESQLVNRALSDAKGEVLTNCHSSPAQMPTSRCAHLCLVAAANKSYEAWVSYQAILYSMWLYQYFPYTYIREHLKVFTKETISDCVNGKFPKGMPAWKPLFK